jgi:type II secretory pathway pseudopilin PulG
MLLLGVLAAFVVPRFTGRDVFDDAAAQNQLIAAARLAQQRAMSDRVNCYRLHIENATLTVERADDPLAPVNWQAVGPADWRDGIALATSVANQSVFFDGLGNRVSSCGAASIAGSNVLTLNAGSLAACINGVGYVYRC